jgi:hypothetical protein
MIHHVVPICCDSEFWIRADSHVGPHWVMTVMPSRVTVTTTVNVCPTIAVLACLL